MAYQVKCARSWDELWTIFAADPTAYPVAGGTDIIPRVNQGIESHEIYVIIDDLPDMRGVTCMEDGSVRIGALTKLVEITEEEILFFLTTGGIYEGLKRTDGMAGSTRGSCACQP